MGARVRSALRSALVLLVLAAPRGAAAKILDGTQSLAPGHISAALGAELSLEDPNPIRLEVKERIGLAGGVDLYLDQTIGLHRDDGLRLGGGLKWTVVDLSTKRERPGVALWAGGFFHTGREVAGAAFTALVDYRFGRLRPYAGLDLDMWFDQGVDTRLTVLGGTRIAIVNHLGAYLEAGGGLTGRVRNHLVALGLRLDL